MTTARKAVLIVATVLLVGGSALALGAFAMADFRFENLSNTTRDWDSNTTTLQPETEAPHTQIVLRDPDGDVRFEPAEGDSFEIVYWTSSEKTVDVVDEGGVLEITGEGTPLSGVMIMKVEFQDRSTVVKVPRSFTGSITAETSSGNVDAMELDGLEALTLTSGSGSLSTMHVSAGAVTMKTSSGTVGAVGVNAKSVQAATSSGSLSLSDIDAEAVETSTTSGSQDFGDLRTGTLKALSSSGGIETAVIDADSAEFESSSGTVRALFAGAATDYDIAASSLSGHVGAPSGALGAGKRISAHTASGSIDLKFSKGSEPTEGSERDTEDLGQDATTSPGAPAAPASPAAPEAP